MNCPSRVEVFDDEGRNQNPSSLSADTTTRADLNGIINVRDRRDEQTIDPDSRGDLVVSRNHDAENICGLGEGRGTSTNVGEKGPIDSCVTQFLSTPDAAWDPPKGFSLCIKLGSVTGLNLAEHCREHLPRWLNYFLYFLAESAIIATDIAEVIGSAIALNLLIKVPLVAGCALTLADVLIILLFYNPSGSMRRLRYFEYFVMALVLGVTICFCIQLSYIADVSVGEVFRGYIPSSSIVQAQGLYLSCGILGATVMPHSLYLGSGVVQARLHEFDIKSGNILIPPSNSSSSSINNIRYRPSLQAIRNCMNYSIAELAIALFTFALFVNSAILITAGASLSNNSSAQNADLFGIHDLLSSTIAPVAGTIFALALLLSGTSAGIIATIAGQMVSEGSLNWTCAPWLRRLITRSISITPSIIIAAAVGQNGLTAALNGTQIALSVILPFVSAPLIYFTCRNKYMTVSTDDGGSVKMRNHWITAIFAVLTWGIIVVMNVALLVLVGLGKA
ncbi:natural resistance-associated macrophage protein [Acephala macrosclerotiorum]|nr:natural resistance-associated macrophage protein [Acephala macrosclerotiorum]